MSKGTPIHYRDMQASHRKAVEAALSSLEAFCKAQDAYDLADAYRAARELLEASTAKQERTSVKRAKCKACNGTGKIATVWIDRARKHPIAGIFCPTCQGTGKQAQLEFDFESETGISSGETSYSGPDAKGETQACSAQSTTDHLCTAACPAAGRFCR